jgi:RNA polymerase sigma factor (sigma-70 family)
MAKRGDRPDQDAVSNSTLYVLERAQQGDELAVRILIERALPSVRRWARGRLPRYARAGEDTEDIVQDAFLGTLKGLKRFQHRTVGGLQAYLRQSVMNRIRDLIRLVNRRGTDGKLESDPKDWAPSPLEEAIMRQQLDRFLEALGRLRPSDRQVIVWRIELGYTADEIAGKLGKSKAAAGMTVSRAMDKLARELDLESPVSK